MEATRFTNPPANGPCCALAAASLPPPFLTPPLCRRALPRSVNLLTALDLSNNRLSGTIPESMHKIVGKDVTVDLRHNLLACCVSRSPAPSQARYRSLSHWHDSQRGALWWWTRGHGEGGWAQGQGGPGLQQSEAAALAPVAVEGRPRGRGRGLRHDGEEDPFTIATEGLSVDWSRPLVPSFLELSDQLEHLKGDDTML